MMTILLSILIFLLVFFIYYCAKFALIIIKMQDSLENSLDKIDEKYLRINEILEIPLFFDSPEVRRLLVEIDDVRNVVLDISSDLSNINQSKKETKDLEDINKDKK